MFTNRCIHFIGRALQTCLVTSLVVGAVLVTLPTGRGLADSQIVASLGDKTDFRLPLHFLNQGVTSPLVTGCYEFELENGLLHEASLKNGDYGDGQPIDTMDPDHGGSPHVLGIVDSAEGVTFTPTEVNGQSNALINWQILDENDRNQFRLTGTISFWIKVDSENFVEGEIIGENYGFDQFRNGQSSFAAWAIQTEDGWRLRYNTLNSGQWFVHGNVDLLHDCWYHVGIAWGGLINDYETWVNGALLAYDSQEDAVLPWGMLFPPSGINVGLGDNHERGWGPYGSASGVTFADIRFWKEYQDLGDTIVRIAPTFTSSESETFVVGESGFFPVTTDGIPVAVIELEGALPEGISFTDYEDGTATLAGIPAVGTDGVYPLTFKAYNGVCPNATQDFTLTVEGAPEVTLNIYLPLLLSQSP